MARRTRPSKTTATKTSKASPGLYVCTIAGCKAKPYQHGTDLSRHKWIHLPREYRPKCPYVSPLGEQCPETYVGRTHQLQLHWEHVHWKSGPCPKLKWPSLAQILEENHITLGEQVPPRRNPTPLPSTPVATPTPEAPNNPTVENLGGMQHYTQGQMYWYPYQQYQPSQGNHVGTMVVDPAAQGYSQAQPYPLYGQFDATSQTFPTTSSYITLTPPFASPYTPYYGESLPLENQFESQVGVMDPGYFLPPQIDWDSFISGNSDFSLIAWEAFCRRFYPLDTEGDQSSF